MSQAGDSRSTRGKDISSYFSKLSFSRKGKTGSPGDRTPTRSDPWVNTAATPPASEWGGGSPDISRRPSTYGDDEGQTFETRILNRLVLTDSDIGNLSSLNARGGPSGLPDDASVTTSGWRSVAESNLSYESYATTVQAPSVAQTTDSRRSQASATSLRFRGRFLK